MGRYLEMELRLKEIRDTIKSLGKFTGKDGFIENIDARLFLTEQRLSNSDYDLVKLFVKESENELAISKTRCLGSLLNYREE